MLSLTQKGWFLEIELRCQMSYFQAYIFVFSEKHFITIKADYLLPNFIYQYMSKYSQLNQVAKRNRTPTLAWLWIWIHDPHKQTALL